MSIEKTNPVLSAVSAGIVASGIQSMMFPGDIKAAIKNARLGEDIFVAKAKAMAEATKAELTKPASTIVNNFAVKTHFSSVNPESVAQKAKEMFPEMVEKASKANKQLFKTFGIVAGTVLGAKLLASAIAKHKANKAE